MAPANRNKRLNILVTEQEHAQLLELAEQAGVSASDYVRIYIRRQHNEASGGLPTLVNVAKERLARRAYTKRTGKTKRK